MFKYILIGVSLAMDAFAVSICQGMAVKRNKRELALRLALTFGIFQSAMPIIGFYIGNAFSSRFSNYGNIIACIILVGLGINMLRDANKEEECALISNYKMLLLLAVSTSVDALIVGVSFALGNKTNILLGVIIIGIVTFIISYLGTTIGDEIKKVTGKLSSYFGGIVLIVLGVKSLIDKLL